MPRALVKLLDYSRRNLDLPADELLSCIMELKDLGRGSVICDHAADTAQIFANLTTENPFFKVYKFKNGFADASKKKTDYRDIKVVLMTQFDDTDFDELVEVQII